jgi:hypothetical protein
MRMGWRTGGGIEVGRLVGMISDKTCRQALSNSGHMSALGLGRGGSAGALNRWAALVAAQ